MVMVTSFWRNLVVELGKSGSLRVRDCRNILLVTTLTDRLIWYQLFLN